MKLEAGYKTDKGRQRSHNEDACLVMTPQDIFAVADGVGGSNAGEIASSSALQVAEAFFTEMPPQKDDDEDQLGYLFRRCVDRINQRVVEMAKATPERKGMACTLLLAYVTPRDAYFVNVGDSRGYIYRGGSLFKITEDHSYVNKLVSMGVLTRDEAEAQEDNHVITRAIGANTRIAADYYRTGLVPGDVLLLCTDGLYNELSEETIAGFIKKDPPMQQLADTLVEAANEAGGRDNITAVCIKVIGKDEENGQ